MTDQNPPPTPASTGIVEVIVTGPPDWLPEFTRKLVDDRLAACGQHINPIRSIYQARVALHTTTDLATELIERIRRDHTYEIPCVLVFPILDANPDYADWVKAETRQPTNR